jgi:hypothetical protein
MVGVHKLLALVMACFIAAAWGPSASSATVPTGSVLKVGDLPAGWIVDRAELVGNTPPCIASAEAPLESFPERRAAFAGETSHLAVLDERVISIPGRDLKSRYSAVLCRYAACNRATWTRGRNLKFTLSITRRPSFTLGKIHVAGFSISVSSPSRKVVPNPLPGLVDFAVVGHEIVLVAI